jgi:hypothetical protein
MEEDNTVFPSGWRSANVNLERQPIHSLVNMRRSFESHNEELNIDKRVAEEITLHARSTKYTPHYATWSTGFPYSRSQELYPKLGVYRTRMHTYLEPRLWEKSGQFLSRYCYINENYNLANNNGKKSR